MAVIKYVEKERDLLARLMRAEAIGEGELGMLMVGNVVVNRVLANCLTFSNPTTLEKNLADRVIKGEYYYPATHALWFYAPKSGEACKASWWGQYNSGRYKNHCFYVPETGICNEIR